jgi:hypothetical protein
MKHKIYLKSISSIKAHLFSFVLLSFKESLVLKRISSDSFIQHCGILKKEGLWCPKDCLLPTNRIMGWLVQIM